ncbi:MAG: DUF4390 domain-containing protein [Gammaproteobacteria bacterium]|nr:DUF4390 domain-containing protein [Gammaproteobacteria bacterium]
MKTQLIYKGAQLIAERRQRKRCPECQFFIALAVVLTLSLMLLFLFNLFPRLTSKGEFQISSARTYEVNGSIVIDADLKMNFPEEVVEALENGIPLTIAVEVQLYRERQWWRNIIIKESLQLFELFYHPLTNVHEVKNIATEDRYSFNSRQDAMAVLGTIRSAHLIDKKMLEQTGRYYVQMHTLLDISRLPPALRQIASLSPSWRLESPWYRLTIDNSKTEQEQEQR